MKRDTQHVVMVDMFTRLALTHTFVPEQSRHQNHQQQTPPKPHHAVFSWQLPSYWKEDFLWNLIIWKIFFNTGRLFFKRSLF